MKERTIELKPFIKPDDPDDLAVFAGCSAYDEIRFYLNETQYITGIENGEGFDLRVEEEEFDENSSLNTQGIQRIDDSDEPYFVTLKRILSESFSECKGFLFKSLSIFLIIFLLGFYLMFAVKNIALTFCVGLVLYYVLVFARVFIYETIEMTYDTKSKHACEHKMIDFLEKYKRLPRTMEEIKNASRFTPHCGCRELVEQIGSRFFLDFVSAVIAFAVYTVNVFVNSSIAFEMFIITFFLAKFIVLRLINNEYLLDYIEKLQDGLTYLMQLANTTEDYDEYDAVLVYFVARERLKLVYPNFYDEETDTFLDNLMLKINVEM